MTGSIITDLTRVCELNDRERRPQPFAEGHPQTLHYLQLAAEAAVEKSLDKYLLVLP